MLFLYLDREGGSGWSTTKTKMGGGTLVGDTGQQGMV